MNHKTEITLGASFLQRCREFADRPALWSRGELLTYRELHARVIRLSAVVAHAGAIRQGDRVAVLADRTPTLYVSLLSALVSGAAYVPLNSRYPAHRNRAILARSGATVLLCDNRNQGAVAELLDGSNAVHTVVNADRGEILLERATASRVTEETNEDPDTRDLAYILFTSGSTGEPKGVPITNANVFAYLQTAVELSEIGPNDRTIQLVEVTFDLSVHDMFLTWLHGACLYSVPENASLMATRFVEEHGITGWMSVPSTAGISKQSGALGSADLSSLRFTFFCGEPLTRGVAEAWSSAAPHSRIYNVYGPTEATVAFSWFRFDRPATDIPHIVPLGQANHGQELGLFTPEGCRAAEGEICMSGSQVMRGYWKAPEITASRFFQAEGRRWYRTGDIGRHDPALGYLFAGRIDQQVKIRGFRVELQEIETIVRRVSGRDIVAVVPWPVATDVGATGCVAFVAGKPMDADELRLACASILPDYMVPQRFVFEESLPLNSNGKIDYGALKRHHTLGAAV